MYVCLTSHVMQNQLCSEKSRCISIDYYILREGVHNEDIAIKILYEVNRDLEASTRSLARQFGIGHLTIWKIINREGLNCYY